MALQKQTHGDRAGDKGTGHSSKVQTGQADSPAVTGLPSVFHVPGTSLSRDPCTCCPSIFLGHFVLAGSNQAALGLALSGITLTLHSTSGALTAPSPNDFIFLIQDICHKYDW